MKIFVNNWRPKRFEGSVPPFKRLISPYWSLFFLLFLSAWLRLPHLAGSLWLDEAGQALEAISPWYQQLQLANDFQPPLYHLWLYLWQLVSHQEWWLRLSSMIPGLASVVLLAAWQTKRQGLRAGVWLGVLLATSSLHIFYSQELRPYILAFWWASASFVFWQAYWSQPRRTTLWGLTLVNVAGALTSYVYLLWIVTQVLVTLSLKRSRWWMVFQSAVVSLIWWLIWWPGFWQQWLVAKALRHNLPGWEEVVSLPQLKAPFLVLAQLFMGHQPVDLNAVYLLLIGSFWSIVLLLTVWMLWRTKGSERQQILVWSLVLLGQLGIAWLFSWWTPVLATKRVLWMIPLLYLWLLQIVPVKRVWGTVLLLLVLIMNLWGTFHYYANPARQRENWRGAVAEIEWRYQSANTAVVFAFDAPFAPWEWYSQEAFPTFSTGTKPLPSLAAAQQALQGIHQYENVIVFDYLRDLTDPQHFIDQELESEGYRLLEVLDYPGLGFIRLYYRQPLFALIRDAQHL